MAKRLNSSLKASYDAQHAFDFTAFDFSTPPSSQPALDFTTDNNGALSRTVIDKDPDHLYPSPPSSGPTQNVPLPNLSPSRKVHFGGVLDSPIIHHHSSLTCHAPISPPPTIPTPTHALPPPNDARDSETFASDQFQHSPSNRPHAENPLLSPLSPEWETDRPVSDNGSESVLLSEQGQQEKPHSPLSPVNVFDPPPFGGRDKSPDPSWTYATDPHSNERPTLHLLHIPESSSYSIAMDDSDDMEVDRDSIDCEILVDNDEPYVPSPPLSVPDLDHDSLSPISTLTSPSPTFNTLPDLSDFDDEDFFSKSPCSPSRRLSYHLPDIEMDDQGFLSTPSSPLVSLPGAEVDDDLIPLDLGLPNYIPDAPKNVPFSNGSLLLLDSKIEIPVPPSPSPEDLDVDLEILHRNPDLLHLCILRKKAQEMEHALRQVEEQLLEQGALEERAQVRRERKMHKERSKELTALLKLKFDEDIFYRGSCTQSERVSKKTITSMAQLVARMVFKRRERTEITRPIASATKLERRHTVSSLRHCFGEDGK